MYVMMMKGPLVIVILAVLLLLVFVVYRSKVYLYLLPTPPVWMNQRQITFKEHGHGFHGISTLRRSIVFSYSQSYDFTWLDKYRSQNIEINAFDVYNSTADGKSKNVVPVNKGREAMVYLTYIINNYDNLPDSNLFVHGHHESWHQKSNLNGIVEHLNWDYNSFANLRCVIKENAGDSPRLQKKCITYQPTPRLSSNFSCVNMTGPSYLCHFDQLWVNVMEKYGFGELPSFISTQCCSQFFVSKQTVLRNSKEFYMDLRREIMKDSTDSYNVGISFEFLWHIMFTNQSIFCPTYEECYCKLYNLCSDYEIKNKFYDGTIKL